MTEKYLVKNQERPQKWAAVFDLDGVIGRDDAAGRFWKSLGLETEYSHLTKTVLAARNNHGKNMEKLTQEVIEKSQITDKQALEHAIRSRWPLPRGTVLSILLELNSHRNIPVAKMQEIGQKLPLTRGAGKLIEALKKHPKIGRNNIFINSATYGPIAVEVAKRLGIPEENVFSTKVNSEKGMLVSTESVNGGINKLKSLEEISRQREIPFTRMLGFGDSPADVPFLAEISKAGGFSFWFNPDSEVIGKNAESKRGKAEIPGRRLEAGERGQGVIVAANSMKHLHSLIDVVLRHEDQGIRREKVRQWLVSHKKYARRSGLPGVTQFYPLQAKVRRSTRVRVNQSRERVRR